jgi:hypothetical protein
MYIALCSHRTPLRLWRCIQYGRSQERFVCFQRSREVQGTSPTASSAHDLIRLCLVAVHTTSYPCNMKQLSTTSSGGTPGRPLFYSLSAVTAAILLLLALSSHGTLLQTPGEHSHLASAGPPRLTITRHNKLPWHKAFKRHDNFPPQAERIPLNNKYVNPHVTGSSGKDASLLYDMPDGGDGMVVLNQRGLGFNKQFNHPFLELIESAEQKWRKMVDSQSKNLNQAVKEYKRRYKMVPPTGYDAWFTFCQENKVVLVDEFDELMRDVMPFHALSPKEFRGRINSAGSGSEAYRVKVEADRHEVIVSGAKSGSEKATDMRRLLEGVVSELPAGFKVEIPGVDEALSKEVLADDLRAQAVQLAQSGECKCSSARTAPC